MYMRTFIKADGSSRECTRRSRGSCTSRTYNAQIKRILHTNEFIFHRVCVLVRLSDVSSILCHVFDIYIWNLLCMCCVSKAHARACFVLECKKCNPRVGHWTPRV